MTATKHLSRGIIPLSVGSIYPLSKGGGTHNARPTKAANIAHAWSETVEGTFCSVIRGHCIYKSVWTPVVGEELNLA